MPAAKKSTRTLADFNAEFNPDVRIPAKIRAGLASLRAEGADAWEYEVEFLRRAAVANVHISAYRDDFKAHIVEVKVDGHNTKRVWFADAKVAAKARGA